MSQCLSVFYPNFRPWEANWNKIILLALVGLPKWLKGGEVVEIPKEVENKEPETTEARHGCNSMLASGFLTSHGIAVKARWVASTW